MTIASILDAVKAHEEQDRLVAAGYQTSINELQAKLTGAPVAPTPAPVSGRTFFGACPTNSGTVEQVVSKYGTGVAVRRFMGDLTAAAVRPAGVGVMHWSWKPTLAGITPALVTSALKACQDNDGVEVWHEGDKKVRDGVFSRADLIAIKNKFWTTV